ncbi:MAG: hypothetical protein ABEJ92_04545 [Halobacteriales archaeon]
MPSREALGWALLFAVPPAVGVTGYATMVIGEGLFDPRAWLAGGLVFAVVFSLVLGSRAVGAAEPAAARERID